MSLKGIISISGMPGLFKVLAQTKSGFIVESLSDKKRMPVASTQRISMLEDISVYTTSEDLPLKEVMLKLIAQAENAPLIDAKSDAGQLRDFFKSIVPEYDAERVYPSDIKKIISWFHMVKDIVTVADEAEEPVTPETISVEAGSPVETSTEKAIAKVAPAPGKKSKSAPKTETATPGADAETGSVKTRKKTASK